MSGGNSNSTTAHKVRNDAQPVGSDAADRNCECAMASGNVCKKRADAMRGRNAAVTRSKSKCVRAKQM